jgi:toxin ParE1/3/4
LPCFVRTARAEEDLADIWVSIAADNERAADAQLDRIDAVCITLASFPELGRARPDLAPELRYMVVGRYLILYRIIPDQVVEVVRVVMERATCPTWANESLQSCQKLVFGMSADLHDHIQPLGHHGNSIFRHVPFWRCEHGTGWPPDSGLHENSCDHHE